MKVFEGRKKWGLLRNNLSVAGTKAKLSLTPGLSLSTEAVTGLTVRVRLRTVLCFSGDTTRASAKIDPARRRASLRASRLPRGMEAIARGSFAF